MKLLIPFFSLLSWKFGVFSGLFDRDRFRNSIVRFLQLMNLLFSFIEPEHPHSALLAGYFSKVSSCNSHFDGTLFWKKLVLNMLCFLFLLLTYALLFNSLYSDGCCFVFYLQVVVCLLLRKTVPLMNYIQVIYQ